MPVVVNRIFVDWTIYLLLVEGYVVVQTVLHPSLNCLDVLEGTQSVELVVRTLQTAHIEPFRVGQGRV